MKLRLARKLIQTGVVCVGLLASSLAPATAQETQTLSLDQARVLADQALQSGNFGLARALSLGLLEANENDFNALVLAASAEIAMGNFKSAAAFASRAYRIAPNSAAKLHASRLAASARFRDGKYFGAEYWLRAARQNAQTQAEINAVRDEFAAVKRENPLSVSLNFSVAPNSNINNGSESEFITIWGLPFLLSPDARALSGYEVSLGFDARLKVSENQTHKTEIGLVGSGRTYDLSAESRAAAPDVSGSDYSFAALETYLRHSWVHRAATGPANVSLNIGRNWYGGDPYTHYTRLALGQQWRWRSGHSLNFGLNFQRQVNESDGVASFVRGMSVNVVNPATQTGRLSYGLAIEGTLSDNVGNVNHAKRINLGYSFARPIAGTNVSMRLGLEQRDYPNSPYDVTGRHDATLTTGIDIAMPQLSYFGFSPVLSIEGRRSHSNISLYQRSSYGMRLGVQSRF